MNKTLIWFCDFLSKLNSFTQPKKSSKRIHNAFEFWFDRFLCFNWTFVRGKKSLFSVSKINRNQWSLSFCTSQWPRRYSTLAFPPQKLGFFFIIYYYLFRVFFYIYFYYHYFVEKETEKKFRFTFASRGYLSQLIMHQFHFRGFFSPWILNCLLIFILNEIFYGWNIIAIVS